MLKLITVSQFCSYWLNSISSARRMVLCAALLLCSWSTMNAYDVSLEPGASTAYEEGAVVATARLARVGLSGQLDVSVQITAGSSAILTTDYSLQWYNSALASYVTLGADPTIGVGAAASTGTIRFQPGEASVNIILTPVNDTTVEAREYVILAINYSAKYNIGQYPSRRLTIADNDHKALIEVIQPVADEDTALRGDPDDTFSRRRGIVRVRFDAFPDAADDVADPFGLNSDYLTSSFSRNIVVQFLTTSGTIPSATLTTDYAVKYKISGHSHDGNVITDSHSQIGRVNNSNSGLSITTGLNYRLMAAITGDTIIPLQEQESDDLTTINVVPVGAILYFESDPSQQQHTVTASGPSSMIIAPGLTRPIPSGTKVKIISLPAMSVAPDSVIVERTFPQGSTQLLLGEGFGDLFEGDVIKLRVMI